MSDDINDGGLAFPYPEIRGPNGEGIMEGAPGMSLRDYFAAKALQGILAGPCSRPGTSLKEWFDVPEIAYGIADQMLAVRSAKDPT